MNVLNEPLCMALDSSHESIVAITCFAFILVDIYLTLEELCMWNLVGGQPSVVAVNEGFPIRILAGEWISGVRTRYAISSWKIQDTALIR